ncbi:MAG: Oligopeptide ABC transporter, permease protein OppC (TC 3.A.1.5.1) [uncultured Caballeronia sp.]|nr:MAG: Oligopeptide ABC transporter, permease protein OppC (TC 3.A.1.5.1) [uncultured Caballeronia sp.]
MGVSTSGLILRHIVPNLLGIVAIYTLSVTHILSHARLKPGCMSAKRRMLRHTTVLPGGASLLRARR